MSDAAGTTGAAAQAAAAAAAPGTPGDAGTGGTGAASPATVAAQAAAAAPAGAVAEAGAAAGAADAAAGNTTDTTGWPPAAVAAYEKAQAAAARYQREAGDSRINAKAAAAADATKAAVKAINDALGIETPSDATPTLEQATQTITERDQSLAAEKRSKAAILEAWKQGVDPNKLGYLNYQLSQDAAFGALDPAAADFGAKLAASISTLVGADQTLKLSGTAVASGVEQLGGASGSTTISQEAFDGMSMAERGDLYRSDKATYEKLVGRAS